MSRSLAPANGLRAGAVSAKSSHNIPPSATILSPTLSTFFTSLLPSPVTIQWTGNDPDGDVREYRYRVFTDREADFHVADFVAFMNANPDSVLHFYAPNFDGWASLRAPKDSVTASVTYSSLLPYRSYMFAVVAIDKQGAWDQHLTRSRNMLKFQVLEQNELSSRK